MLGLVASLPDQCGDARARSGTLEVPPAARGARHLHCAGMGGSAIAAELLAATLDDANADRVRVHRGWGLPAWIPADTLVVISSYSGGTPETLSAYEAARDRGFPIVAISSGGPLAEWVRRDGVAWVELPGGLPPRAAVGYGFFPLLRLAADLGIARAEDVRADIAAHLRPLATAWGPGRRSDDNVAKQLAAHLAGRLPLIHAATSLARAAGHRFMTQLA